MHGNLNLSKNGNLLFRTYHLLLRGTYSPLAALRTYHWLSRKAQSTHTSTSKNCVGDCESPDSLLSYRQLDLVTAALLLAVKGNSVKI